MSALDLRENHQQRLMICHRYHAEPSGTFYRYDAKAIGSGSEGAQAELVNEYHKYVHKPRAHKTKYGGY